MALELNFLHEQLHLQKRRNRDPFKLALLSLLSLAIALVLFYFYRADHARRIRAQHAGLQEEYRRLAPLQAEALKQQQLLELAQKTSEKVITKIDGRFLWAPLLEQIVQTIPRNVQLTRINGGLLANDRRRIIVDLAGIALEKQPRIAAEGVRAALAQKLAQTYEVNASFESLEDGAETASLDGQSLPTALFSIRLEIVRPMPLQPAPQRRARTP